MEKRRNRDALLDDQTPVIPNSALLFSLSTTFPKRVQAVVSAAHRTADIPDKDCPVSTWTPFLVGEGGGPQLSAAAP